MEALIISTDCTEKCYICLENLDDVSGNLKCGCINRYHTNCIHTWLLVKNECPICKKKINEHKTQNENNNGDEEENGDDDDDFELEVDDNDIFYNPLVYFISVYIVYFIALFLFNHFIYLFFMKK
jgi:hypothetical protein